LTCLWCDQPFNPGTRGEPKRFCSTRCRQDFHAAARRWAIAAVETGRLTVAELRDAPQKPCAVYTAPSRVIGHPGAEQATSRLSEAVA